MLRKNSMDDIDPSFECSCLCSLHPGVSLVWTAARSCLVIHPVFLCVTHSMTAGDLARLAGSVERTGARAVAESLSAVAALARVPVIDDHLNRHLASPNASGALLLVGSCRQSPVTAFAVDRKRRWNTTPRWRRCLFRDLTCSIFQIADLGRMTCNCSEVISSPAGLVPTNALVLSGLVNFRVVASLDRKQKERRMKPAKRDKTRRRA